MTPFDLAMFKENKKMIDIFPKNSFNTFVFKGLK